MQPYIGVTGVMTSQEVKQLIDAIPFFTTRSLMLGVLVSLKTLNGIPNKYPQRYPKIGSIRDIFWSNPRVLNLVHYNNDDQLGLCTQLLHLEECCGVNLGGFQLNIAWPSMSQFEEYVNTSSKPKRIVLQILINKFIMSGSWWA